MNAQDHVAAYVGAEIAAYQQAAAQFPRVARRRFPTGKQKIWYRRINGLARWHAERGLDMPGALLRPYAIPVIERVRGGIPLKYQYRGLNALRELARANLLFRDLLTGDAALDVLDLSAGACGIAEVWGHHGHRVMTNDYYASDQRNEVGHSYAPIHRELRITCHRFDGRDRPYAFATASHDIVLCHQALDAYGPVPDWNAALDEMRRVARRAVGLVLNPPAPRTPENLERAAAFVADLRDRHGALSGACPETGLTALRIDIG